MAGVGVGRFVVNSPKFAQLVHRRRLAALRHGPFQQPRTLRDWLKPATARWLWYGRLGLQPWADALECEQQILIDSGWLERRWLVLPPRVSLENPALVRTVVGRTRFALHGDSQQPGKIRVTARPADLAEFSRVLATLTRERSKG